MFISQDVSIIQHKIYKIFDQNERMHIVSMFTTVVQYVCNGEYSCTNHKKITKLQLNT